MFDVLACWVIPLEIVVTMREVDILLMKDGCPLEGCGVLGLASGAVAELAVERLLPVEFVANTAAVAAGFVDGFEMLVGVMDTVWRPLLPLGDVLVVRIALGACPLRRGLSVLGHGALEAVGRENFEGRDGRGADCGWSQQLS